MNESVLKDAIDNAPLFEGSRSVVGITAAALLAKQLPPPIEFIPGRIPAGLVLIAGRPKCKKSWFALQAALAAVSGREFMGGQPQAGSVLYLALEDNQPRMRERLRVLGAGDMLGAHLDRLDLRFHWPRGAEGVEAIGAWLIEHPDARAIVVDVLARFRDLPNAKASAYAGDYEAMTALHTLAARHPKLLLLVVHHTRKGKVDEPIEAISGTFGIVGAADAFIVLSSADGDPNKAQAHIDGRDWRSWDHDFLWQWTESGWKWLGAGDALLTDGQRDIIEFIREMGPCGPKEVAEWKQCGKSTAFEALDVLVDKGALFRSKGKYHLRDPNGSGSVRGGGHE